MKYFLALLVLCAAQLGHATGPVKVAVIDTGLDVTDPRFSGLVCPDSHDFTGRGLVDVEGHGTHVAGLIKRYAGPGGYCLLVLKWYSSKSRPEVNFRRISWAFRYAIRHGARIVNFSGGGPNWSNREEAILREARDVQFIVAAGNNGKDTSLPGNEFFPGAYRLPNVVAVGAWRQCADVEHSCCQRLKESNYGPWITAWEVGEDVYSTLPCKWVGNYRRCAGFYSGTSMATAIHTGKIVGKELGYVAGAD